MEKVILDVREYPEFAAGHIHEAQLLPLRELERECEAWKRDTEILLVCKSGRRAQEAHALLSAKGFTSLAVLEGGMDAWKAAGKPVRKAACQPWAMERQVRTVAGSLILLFFLLGVFVSHYFILGTAFVGAGLMFAGISDTCMMASLLGKMPWNRASGCCR